MSELLPVITVSALLLAAIALIGMLLASGRARRSAQEQSQRLEALQADLRALCNAAVQVGERVNRLEQAARQLQQRQQELGVRQDQMVVSEPEGRSYDQAIRLAQKGAPLEEIMEICDLSRGEAELITMMHRLDRTQ